MLFGRNRDVKIEHVTLPEHLRDVAEEPEVEREYGPWDISEKDVSQGYLDLGVLKLPINSAIAIRLDVEEKSQTIIGVTLTHENSTLQIQTFAAPRSAGVWEEVKEEIVESLTTNNNGTVEEQEGDFGTELLAKIPAKTSDGRPGYRVARFIGVDGNRWFIRAVLGGAAALKPEAGEELMKSFKNCVIARGNKPHPAREILRLTPPKNARPVRRKEATARAQQQRAQRATGESGMPQRGPEITEVR